jgi:hypothetical protein
MTTRDTTRETTKQETWEMRTTNYNKRRQGFDEEEKETSKEQKIRLTTTKKRAAMTRYIRGTIKYKMVTKTKPEMTSDATRETTTKQETWETRTTNYNKKRQGFDEEEKGDIEGAENKADDDEEEEVYEEERAAMTRNMRGTIKYKMVTKTKPQMTTRDATRETTTKQEMKTR